MTNYTILVPQKFQNTEDYATDDTSRSVGRRYESESFNHMEHHLEKIRLEDGADTEGKEVV